MGELIFYATNMKEEVAADWIKKHLVGLDVDEDVLGDYIASIVSDESSDIDSRLEVVDSILTGYTDCDVSPFLSELRSFLESPPEIDVPAEEEAEPAADQQSNLSLRERINKERMEAQKEVKVRKAIDEKEMRKRERLLNTYGFDVLDTDEQGNLIYRQKAEEKDPLEGMNDNALRVKMAEKMKREAMKVAHDSEVRRNKELEAKRKADKEKRKTVKQERKGRGNYM